MEDSSETVDIFTLVCYIRFSDRVAETCEARNRGRAYGSLPLLLYRGEYYDEKTFASFEQQIQHLEDKVIIISDRAYAEAMLKQIGYFPLIGGYKHLFRVPFTKTYKIGTTFEEIVALYEFDSDLRDLFFKYLLQIERNLRSLMSYYFTEKYGESQDAYLDSSNYNTNRRNQKVVARLISTLNTRLKSDTLDFAFSFAEYTA